MPNVIVDTDILIDFSRGNETAATWIAELEPTAKLAISSVTQMELFVGALNKTHLRDILQFLERYDLIHINENISLIAADLVLQFSLSHKLRAADSLIAATAISLNYAFATKNQRDFRFIQALKLCDYP